MTPQDQLNTFLNAYASYVKTALQPTQEEMRAILEHWRQPAHWEKYKRTNRIPIPTPIRTVFSRIKRPEQVVDKVLRKTENFPAGLTPDSIPCMHDALGIRIVVWFLSHLPLVDRELRNSDLFEISEAAPATAYMTAHRANLLSLGHLHQEEKESGYSAVHYILRLKNSTLPRSARPWFEIQVQTVTQELWSEMEHHLGYKPGKRTNIAARRQFRILSQMLSAVDSHFDLLYEELNRYQEEQAYDDDDGLSAENLSAVLAEHGISCAQRDINNILVFLISRGVETVRDFRDTATPRRLAIIRNTYLQVTGRLPVSLEVIANVAALAGAENEQVEVDRVRSQILYRGAWDSIRQEFSGR
jgi:ppGpp synthetase/RelA/SpoT-type nucleotidyltranferase